MDCHLPQPDWPYWLNLAEVSLREALWLSLDIDPICVDAPTGDPRIRDLPRGWWQSREGDYLLRLEIAGSHLMAGTLDARRDSVRDPTKDIERQYYVRLATFRTWAEALPTPFSFPDEFPGAPSVPLWSSPVDERTAAAFRTESATHAANARHNQPGGYRDKHEQLKAGWASGQYPSRNECAKQMYAVLGLSLSAARRALIGTPEPSQTRSC